ncbi:hypothetical protein MSG28_009305 [Choristoneura fumiferana]|uniref:Uncharacterized protein n=1 Tax=Choristoneura fumiferana TaxID=7141 RepID=A0ACC0KX06_CHOFU|nr:hypothetical protein MSG28_009305 [Choristoneura fumiferana]
MSHQLGRVVSEILLRYYGEIVQQVGNDLFTYGSKTITMIMRSTGLPRSQVIESLRTLMKYDLASFEPSANEVIADYKLIPDNEKNISIITLKDTFVSLATAGYIQQAPVAEMKEGSEIPTLVPVATIVPELDGRALVQAMTSGNTADINDKENGAGFVSRCGDAGGGQWVVRVRRAAQETLCAVLDHTVTERLGSKAARIFRTM